MTKPKVAIVRGGPSDEYHVSLASGGHVLEHIDNDTYDVIDIVINPSGIWHREGIETTPEHALIDIDVMLPIVHGNYGEDGTLAQIAGKLGVKYIGSMPLHARRTLDKYTTKHTVQKHGILTPRDILISRTTDKPASVLTAQIFRAMPAPWVVKPRNGGSSLGIVLARSLPQLEEALENWDKRDDMIIEEYIAGTEISSGIVGGFRGNVHYPMQIMQADTPQGRWYDYEQKYSVGGARITTFDAPLAIKNQIYQAVQKIHTACGMRHISRSDFILTKTGKLYFLEVNSIPGLTKHSIVPAAIKAVGGTMRELIHHLIDVALYDK